MLKSLRKVPLYIKRLKPGEFSEGCPLKSHLLLQCRCLYRSEVFEKKAKERDIQGDEDVQRLEREAPFLFKAIKHQKLGITKPKVVTYEPPLIFQPIHVKKQILEDDLSHLGHDAKLSTKKEKVYLIHPRFKREKRDNVLTKHRLAEAEALVNSVHSWGVYSGCIEPAPEFNSKFFFGTGKVLELSEKIRDAINNNGVTMVFLNTGRLAIRQIKELEAIWGCKVFDRYRVILELFKERATTKEAKLQVLLAEIQYMRTHLISDSQYDQQRGGGMVMSGAGETQMEVSKRLLAETEQKTKKALELIKSHRQRMKSERLKKKVPHVAMVGYTNAGKTTLAKALSDDSSLQAEDKLFATLDSTAHRGKLPSGLNLVFIDTVGFISDLPHELIQSFATTLDDVKTADLLVHVADCSHPEFELQCKTVEEVLKGLNVPEETMRSTITVYNKVDLGSQVIPEDKDNIITISATEGTGIEKLRKAIEEKVLKSTGRGNFTINLDLHGGELSWLYRHGTVTDTFPHDDGTLDVTVILNETNKNKFEYEFHTKIQQQETCGEEVI